MDNNKRKTLSWVPIRNKIFLGLIFVCVVFTTCKRSHGKNGNKSSKDSVVKKDSSNKLTNTPKINTTPLVLDTALYNSRLLYLVQGKPTEKWPVKTAYPLPGAILPFKRIVAYYGNYYSARMGILGELSPDEMLNKLQGEVKKWNAADSLMPALPALHYIVVSAQHIPGKNNKYRLRMPFTQIDKTLALAKKIDAIVFLDVQVGWSTLQQEIPLLETYLKLPNVHLAIDPEFSMKEKKRPGSKIGTYDASDINYVSNYLAQLVRKYNLPPKVLAVHRFTKGMLTNYKQIITRPEVQIVINMDGFGFPAKKISSYKLAVVNEPVQFSGFKLFYKNDITYSDRKSLMRPDEILKLYPIPVYIQYQ